MFSGPSRARSMNPLPWLGDPERWGGSTTNTISLSPAGGSEVTGAQIIRAQTENLVAVGWDLVATWSVEGFDSVNDSIQVIWIVTVGTGQASSTLLWNLGSLDPAGGAPNPQAAALGWNPAGTGGVALTGQPLIACALNARPLFQASTLGVAHDVRVSCTGHCAPRGWAP